MLGSPSLRKLPYWNSQMGKQILKYLSPNKLEMKRGHACTRVRTSCSSLNEKYIYIYIYIYTPNIIYIYVDQRLSNAVWVPMHSCLLAIIVDLPFFRTLAAHRIKHTNFGISLNSTD